MKKEGLKAFIFSFSLSLATIMTANSFFASKQKIDNKPIISNKNIVLFINKDNASKTKSHPIKKIALNVLNDTEVKENSTKSVAQNIIIPPKPEDTVIMADNSDKFDYDYIPLNIEINSVQENILLASNEVEELVASPEKIQVENTDIEEIVIAENTLSESIKESEKSEVISAPEIQIAEASIPTFKEINIINESKNKINTQDDENTPSLLIPIEHGGKNNLRIIHDGGRNQVASANKGAPIGIIAEKSTDAKLNTEREASVWKTMEEHRSQKKNSDNSPWVAAIGNKHAKNNLITESDINKSNQEIQQILSPKEISLNDSEVKLAADMIDNLIIPIPEDIKNKKNLTPQLTSSEENKYLEQELDNELGIDREDDNKIVISDAQGNNLAKESKGGFFDNITSIFSSSGNKIDEESSSNENNESVVDIIGKKIGLKRKNMNILPTEIRLSFQPNRAEISGTTLQWIQAFGKKAAEEESVALEIRLDANNSPALQRKRLNLLSNILTSRGVGSHKLNIIYTAREPNSFVIRTIKINSNDKGKDNKKTKQNNNSRYLQW